MGGEKLCPPYGAHNRSGSPPRGRGKAPARDSTQGGAGITPAWAGKRHKAVLSSGRYGDHPRVGGEKGASPGIAFFFPGSPPRGRGKAVSLQRNLRRAGITPAWAGKSGWSASKKPPGRDHPRVGGEKGASPGIAFFFPGSPPRGRGKGGLLVCGQVGHGITPAWAGKSAIWENVPGAFRDHPRVGGEKRMG